MAANVAVVQAPPLLLDKQGTLARVTVMAERTGRTDTLVEGAENVLSGSVAASHLAWHRSETVAAVAGQEETSRRRRKPRRACPPPSAISVVIGSS